MHHYYYSKGISQNSINDRFRLVTQLVTGDDLFTTFFFLLPNLVVSGCFNSTYTM